MKEQANYQKPIVSIITPFLDAQDFLQEAIESVIAQTYEHWELLLVDDGSTDKSTTIAQEYAAQYPNKIRYLDHENHQNRGKSTSRNLGIQQAKGSYITFLDADDQTTTVNSETRSVIISLTMEKPAGRAGPISRTYTTKVRCRNL